MALDQTQNFVEVDIVGTYTSTDTTISLESGGASEVPDPVNGEYNLVWFDALNNAKPSFDPEVEIVRVTGRDTGNDTLTVQRGRENTSAVSHDASDADYKFLLTPTSKLISDIDSANFSTNSLTVANTTIGLGGSGTPEADNLAGNNGLSGQVLQTDGSNASWTDLESETVKTISSNYTTSGETTILIDALATRFDLSASSSTGTTLDVSNESSDTTGAAFNDTGSKLFIVSTASDEILEYSLTSNYDIASASFNQSFSVNSQTTVPKEVQFNDVGSKMYVADRDGERILQYDLSTNFDISTASFNSVTLSTSSEEPSPTGIEFNSDGSKLIIVGRSGKNIVSYDLSTNYDIGTGTLNTSMAAPNAINPQAVTFNDSGSKIFIGAGFNGNVNEYSLSSNFDIDTTSFNTSLSVGNPEGVVFNDSGTKLYVADSLDDIIEEYSSGSSGVANIVLSSSDASQSGKIVRVKDTTGSAGSNSVAIDTESGETIDGSNSIKLNTDFGVKQLQSDGSNWFVISDG